MNKYANNILIIVVSVFIFAVSCTNPFAPAKNDSSYSGSLLGNPTTVEGFFRNFRYSYVYKDTSVYSKLLDPQFTFYYTYYDSDRPDRTMSREEDMIKTSRMFLLAQDISLEWYGNIYAEGDSLHQEITRGFSLRLVLNPTEIYETEGNAYFQLTRNSVNDDWKILKWRDLSK